MIASSFLVQLGIASLMVGFTVLVHFAGLSALLSMVQKHRDTHRQARTVLADAAVIAGAAFGLFALHGVEIWSYALLYWSLGLFTTFEPALYFSTSTYSTVGYGDVVLPTGSRLLGAIESINGVILLGWSTAFFFTLVHRMTLLEREFDRPPYPRASSHE